MKEIILDCDEVLLKWTDGFKNYHDSIYGTNTANVEVKSFSMHDAFKCTNDEIADRAFNFNVSNNFSHLEPLEGAVESIAELKKHAKIHIVTKCGVDDTIIANRTINLRNVFGDVFSSVNYVPEHQSKYAKLAMLKNQNTVLFVDDVIENVDTGKSVGINSVVFTQPHNIDLMAYRTDLVFVPTWAELLKLCKDIL